MRDSNNNIIKKFTIDLFTQIISYNILTKRKYKFLKKNNKYENNNRNSKYFV